MSSTKTTQAKRKIRRSLCGFAAGLVSSGVLISVAAVRAHAASIDVGIDSGTADSPTSALDLLFLLAIIALIPSLILVMTSFTRIVISLSILRSAIGTPTSPPNQVIIGLALFLSLFVMFPVLTDVKEVAYDPFKAGEITQAEAIERGSLPVKEFMLRQVYDKDLDMFMTMADAKGIQDISEIDSEDKLTELSMVVIVPAFITSELKRAFLIGFLLYIPFLIIDIIVSSTLMSMGMVMLPPTTIALPFKLMLFVLVDGWNLLIDALVSGFR